MGIDGLIGICIIAVMIITYMKYKKPSYKTETKCENIKRTEDTINTYDDKGNKRVSVGIYEPNEKPTEEEITYIKDGVKGKGTMKRMPQGLQVFDANGNCILGVTDRLTRIIDKIEIKGITDDEILHGKKATDVIRNYKKQKNQKIWWAVKHWSKERSFVVSNRIKIEYIDDYLVKITIDGNAKGIYIIGVY